MDKKNMTITDRVEKLEILIQMYQAGTADERRRLNRIEEQWEQFVPLVADQIGRMMIAPWMRQNFTLPEALKGDYDEEIIAEYNEEKRGKG